MPSLDDVFAAMNSLPEVEVGDQRDLHPPKHVETQQPHMTIGPSVGHAGNPDDSLEDQAKSRREARDQVILPSPPKKRTTNGLTVTVTGRMRQLIEGEITVDDLDDEELMTGSFRDSSGKLNGGNAKLIPKAMHQEIMRRILTRGAEKVRSDYFGAIDTVAEIMKDTTVDAQIRLRAAAMIIDRTAGKTPDRVEMSVEVKKYEEVMTAIVREIPDDEQDGVVDAEVDDEEE